MNLTLHLTDNCNMDCTYCLREKCPKDMTEEVLIKACDLSFSKGKIAGLCFFGGEPLLKKDLKVNTETEKLNRMLFCLMFYQAN